MSEQFWGAKKNVLSWGNSLRNMGAYKHATRKVLKNSKQKFGASMRPSRYFMRARQVSRKTKKNYGLYKKIKICLVKNLYSTKFCFFYTLCKKMMVFVKQLCEHIECQDIHVTFFVLISWHFKIRTFRKLLKNMSICSRVSKHHPCKVGYLITGPIYLFLSCGSHLSVGKNYFIFLFFLHYFSPPTMCDPPVNG